MSFNTDFVISMGKNWMKPSVIQDLGFNRCHCHQINKNYDYGPPATTWK